MKSVVTLMSLFLGSSMAFAYPACKPSVDLTKTTVRDSSTFGTAQEAAASSMTAGANSVRICSAGSNIVVVTQWNAGPPAGREVPVIEVFSK